MLLNVSLFYLIASLTSKDNQLADYIRSTQVDTWIRLAVALLLSTANSLAEWNISSYLVEYKVKCTAKHSLNLQYLIARVSQVVDSTDDRQSGTYVSLVAEPHTTVACGLLQFHVVLVIARCSNLVGSNHADVVLQECLIQRSNVLACRTVYKHRVKNVHSQHLVAQVLSLSLSLFKKLAIVLEVDAVAIEHASLR